MPRPALIITALIGLSGCNGHAAGFAGYMLAEPVAKLAWHGGKNVYEAASQAWVEMNSEEPGEEE